MRIEKYSFGIGDRFGKEGEAQLEAIQEINKLGIPVVPVWNKSNREHTIVKTNPMAVLEEAKKAVAAKGWNNSYYVDADHIGLATVEEFINYSNFFTIDVANFIRKPVSETKKDEFVNRHAKYTGALKIPGIQEEFEVTKAYLERIADNYMLAVQEVKKIYSHIVEKKGKNNFIPEVSMDECEIAQTPLELFFILAELKYEGINVQTIAPKFTGLFAKGVDYIGDIKRLTTEFEQDVAVIQFAVKELGLPENLKLSVHSGSDKFSIYPVIRETIKKYNAGIHLKTAGTTWLEEVIGLAQAGGEGLQIAKEIYQQSVERFDELTSQYITVLNINPAELPLPEKVQHWTSKQFSDALTHDKNCPDFNPSFRQLIHVGYKIAGEMGSTFQNALETYREKIATNVKYNILDRHLKMLFGI
ncbi:MAG: hypothetical protein JW894_16210 [Bacteroidales bacterium]|nr:hypothetical protein [Bacteroidales bacterium]